MSKDKSWHESILAEAMSINNKLDKLIEYPRCVGKRSVSAWKPLAEASDAVREAAAQVIWGAGAFCARVIAAIEDGRMDLYLLWNGQPGIFWQRIEAPPRSTQWKKETDE
jgi:hypothetical protein